MIDDDNSGFDMSDGCDVSDGFANGFVSSYGNDGYDGESSDHDGVYASVTDDHEDDDD